MYDDTSRVMEIYCDNYQESSCTTKLAPALQGSSLKHVVLLFFQMPDCIQALMLHNT